MDEAAERIFTGRFRVAYLAVKTAAIYAGTFLACYFWPPFLNYLLAPPLAPQTELLAGILLTPLGLLVLGGLAGKRTFLLHLAVLAVAAVMAAALIGGRGADVTPDELVFWWTPLVIVAYVAGGVFGGRAQLARYGEA